jgi:DNA repair ATPase RecN
MIESLYIQNFQSWKEATLEFSSGVNVITGTSDSGKSAIRRAIELVAMNKLAGDSFISHWADNMTIKLKTKEGRVIRKKGKGINKYELIVDKKRIPLKAIQRSDIPEEVRDVLNLSDINMQYQLDAPFLLSKSSGKVAKHFNQVARLDKIDTTKENIAKEIREIEGEIKYKKSDLKAHKEKLEQYPDVDVLEVELEELEEKEIRRKQVSNMKRRLTEIVIAFDRVEEDIKEESTLLKFEEQVKQILEKVEEKKILEDRISMLDSLRTDVEMIDFKLGKLQKKVVLEKAVNNLLQKIADKRKIMLSKDILYTLQYNVLTINKKLLKTQENVLQLETQFKQSFPNVCFLCGTPKKDIKL